eukprot:ANDGO_04299.mRNA.1 hypothetical protein
MIDDPFAFVSSSPLPLRKRSYAHTVSGDCEDEEGSEAGSMTPFAKRQKQAEIVADEWFSVEKRSSSDGSPAATVHFDGVASDEQPDSEGTDSEKEKEEDRDEGDTSDERIWNTFVWEDDGTGAICMDVKSRILLSNHDADAGSGANGDAGADADADTECQLGAVNPTVAISKTLSFDDLFVSDLADLF